MREIQTSNFYFIKRSLSQLNYLLMMTSIFSIIYIYSKALVVDFLKGVFIFWVMKYFLFDMSA